MLINGASGGVGTYAVQTAKALGAEVTGVCGTRYVEMVRSIGADHVIDYTQDDFSTGDSRYDIILDNVGDRSSSQMRRVLTSTGVLQPNGGGHSDGRWVGSLAIVIRSTLTSLLVRQQLSPSVKFQDRDDLAAFAGLLEAGSITPVIDRTWPLSGAAEALGHVGDGHAQGTTVIVM